MTRRSRTSTLISCRNVLIYLEPVLQRRVLPTFHYALEPHGLLVLGSAESVGPASEFFVPLSKRLRIYRRDQDRLDCSRPISRCRAAAWRSGGAFLGRWRLSCRRIKCGQRLTAWCWRGMRRPVW